MSDIEEHEENVIETIQEIDEPVFEIKEKPKKGRAPMSEERKEKLREQLKVAREKKKALKESGVEPPKAPKVVKVLEATASEPAVYVKNVKKIVNTEETNLLKKELAEMKKAKADDARIKQEKKESAAAKRKATKERKELEKKMAEVAPPPKIDRPKPVKVEFSPQVTEISKPRYSTYKKSVWADFM